MSDRQIVLGIETSCDETAASVVADGREVLSNVIASQIGDHEIFGGVVPEIASRRHLEQINDVIASAVSEAGIGFSDIDLIGVTAGPGLVGAVLIGLATAKAMAFALDKPLIGVHHIKGHISAVYPEHEELKPPFLALVVSGGHTELIDVRDYTDFDVLGRTRDDAAGEAFDKVARVLGLGYPGGPKVDAIARKGNPRNVFFKRVMLEKGSLDFSFSGLKTSVLNFVNTERQAGRSVDIADVAAGFEAAAVDVVVSKTLTALKRTGRGALTVGGGVASNSLLRKRLTEACEAASVDLYIPSPIFCTDNAAMIACAAHYEYLAGRTSGLDLDARANLAL